MPDAWLLPCALLAACAGQCWFALSLELHWRQLRAHAPVRATVIVLRVLGASALLLSLGLCLRADHGSMATLVWVMLLAVSALGVAFVLAWRPRWLTPLLRVAGG